MFTWLIRRGVRMQWRGPFGVMARRPVVSVTRNGNEEDCRESLSTYQVPGGLGLRADWCSHQWALAELPVVRRGPALPLPERLVRMAQGD